DVVSSTYGLVGAFVHLHPYFEPGDAALGIPFNKISEQILRQVFLMAKYLQQHLTSAAALHQPAARVCFMTVMRMDGGFGLRNERDIDVIAGGMLGLTKTLALEWPEVFCRSVDVSPEIKGAASCIMAELTDPSRLIIEVGWHKTGRTTPEAVDRSWM
ncbi:MAG: hypothetical protein P1S60_07185, partial [Anaerolineae bacterium]|nr:hypothetical protein [Anaerolineae bacterium]